MADNIELDAGSGGATIAGDEISGVVYQRVKLIHGADGSNDGDVATANPLPIDVQELDGNAIDLGAGNIGSATQRVTLATDQAVVPAGGNVAHDASDSGNPVKVGHKAVAHGSNPSAVAAGDRTDWYANRAGIPFVIGGHPNVVTKSARVEAADNAQTNAALVTVSSGNKIVVTRLEAMCDNANSQDVRVIVGFGSSAVPTPAETGVTGIVGEHPGIPAGGGWQAGNGGGILAVGGDDEDLRFTCEAPTGGSVVITVSYYTVAS